MAKPTDHGTCPTGGVWYECTVTTPSFQGCCTSNACANPHGCPQADLRPAGIPPNGIVVSNEPNGACPATSEWYICTDLKGSVKSFQGCCKSNPCTNTTGAGCPIADLLPGQFRIIPVVSTTLQTSSPISTASKTSTPATTLGSHDSHHASSHKNTPIIAGVVVGGVVLIALMGLIFWYLRSKKTKDHKPKNPSDVATMAENKPDNAVNTNNEAIYAVDRGGISPNHDTTKSTTYVNPLLPSPGPPPYINGQPPTNQRAPSHPSPGTPGSGTRVSAISRSGDVQNQVWRSSHPPNGIHAVPSGQSSIPQEMGTSQTRFAVELDATGGIGKQTGGRD